jgi:hypothetical protein
LTLDLRKKTAAHFEISAANGWLHLQCQVQSKWLFCDVFVAAFKTATTWHSIFSVLQRAPRRDTWQFACARGPPHVRASSFTARSIGFGWVWIWTVFVHIGK